jgi:hypothetical protein
MSRCVNDLNSVRMLLGPGLVGGPEPDPFVGAFIAMSTSACSRAHDAPYPGFIVIPAGGGFTVRQPRRAAIAGVDVEFVQETSPASPSWAIDGADQAESQ